MKTVCWCLADQLELFENSFSCVHSHPVQPPSFLTSCRDYGNEKRFAAFQAPLPPSFHLPHSYLSDFKYIFNMHLIPGIKYTSDFTISLFRKLPMALPPSPVNVLNLQNSPNHHRTRSHQDGNTVHPFLPGGCAFTHYWI